MSIPLDIYGIILAAGASTRMGSPKALLRFDDGSSLLEIQAERLAVAGCIDTAAVIGAEAERIGNELGELDLTWVYNDVWELGQFSSVQAGLAWMLDLGGSGAIVQPVDVFTDEPDTARVILETARVNPSMDAIIPDCGGRGGHPIYISKRAAIRMISVDPEGPDARLDRQIELVESILRLPVDDEGALRNINTPDDWEKIKFLTQDD
jgi:CTP:molybdopterin cytidylyltransferase MocA